MQGWRDAVRVGRRPVTFTHTHDDVTTKTHDYPMQRLWSADVVAQEARALPRIQGPTHRVSEGHGQGSGWQGSVNNVATLQTQRSRHTHAHAYQEKLPVLDHTIRDRRPA